MKFKLFTIIIAITLSSCATGYIPINPKNQNYTSQEEQDDIKIEYKYNVLQKKYAKKEIKKHVNVVALKITNNSNSELVIGKDLIITDSKGSDVGLLDNNHIFRPLKQNVATYFLYLLLTPLNLMTTTSNEVGQAETNSIPIGLVVGPGITAINTITAGTANKKFKDEINTENLLRKTIKPGETISGIIGIRSNNYNSLKISLK